MSRASVNSKGGDRFRLRRFVASLRRKCERAFSPKNHTRFWANPQRGYVPRVKQNDKTNYRNHPEYALLRR